AWSRFSTDHGAIPGMQTALTRSGQRPHRHRAEHLIVIPSMARRFPDVVVLLCSGKCQLDAMPTLYQSVTLNLATSPFQGTYRNFRPQPNLETWFGLLSLLVDAAYSLCEPIPYDGKICRAELLERWHLRIVSDFGIKHQMIR